jgi:hypothetical protein
MTMESDIHEPINLGSSELVSISQPVDIAESFAGIRLKRTYNLNAPRVYRHFLYGGTPAADELAAELIRRFPGLKIVRTYTPPFIPSLLAKKTTCASGSKHHRPRSCVAA